MGRDLRAGLAAQALRSRERFLQLLRGDQARSSQQEFLQQCLSNNAQTAFGRQHSFSRLTSLDEYRAAVPIRHYTQLAPWIDRAVAGETAVLTAEAPIRYWKTTGTTSQPKRIPVTPASATRTMESFLALQGTQLFYYPKMLERNDTALVTHLSPKPIKEFLGPARVPYCTTTELPLEVRPGRTDFVAPWLQGLQQVVEDDAERLYYLLCYAAGHDLYSIQCLHPSRFQTVASTLTRLAPRLIGEVAAGTVLGQPLRQPDPKRAARLQALWEQSGRLRPRDLWPNLQFLSSWSGGYLSRYRALMEESFGADFLPMPSISSEVFLSQTIDPDPISQPLNLRGAVFEFVPAHQVVEAGSTTLQFFELSPNTTYEVIVTTLGGLYRYASCDLFRVDGFIDQVPRLEYMGRRSVSDLTGEKLAEDQVFDAVQATLAEMDLKAPAFTLCAIPAQAPEQRPGYVLVLEHEGGPGLNELAGKLDARFKSVNSRYELKRNFQDLAAVTVQSVHPGTFARYRELRISRGAPAGQLKDPILHAQGAPVLADLLGLSKPGR